MKKNPGGVSSLPWDEKREHSAPGFARARGRGELRGWVGDDRQVLFSSLRKNVTERK